MSENLVKAPWHCVWCVWCEWHSGTSNIKTSFGHGGGCCHVNENVSTSTGDGGVTVIKDILYTRTNECSKYRFHAFVISSMIKQIKYHL